LRLQKAEELLRSDAALSVTQAAFACGFNDANYFSKRFKDLYGVSPVAFRKQKEKR
jgi:AraC family L-rhamnose operon regulatory protein RhaS